MKIRVRTILTTIEGKKIQTLTWERISFFEYVRLNFAMFFSIGKWLKKGDESESEIKE